MTKVFISVPMRGRKWPDVLTSVEILKDMARQYLQDDIEVVSAAVKEKPAADVKNNLTGLWYLGESLKLLSKADFLIGIDSQDSIDNGYYGCEMELQAAKYYHIRYITVPIRTVCIDSNLYKEMANYGK